MTQSPDFRPTTAPLVVAHRGASKVQTENTIDAFETAVAQGADAVELDVRWTADKVAVVCHDPAVEQNGRKVAVKNLTCAEFLAIKREAGVSVPLLDDVLTWARDKTPLVLDIKNTRHEDELIDEIEKIGLHPGSVISSFRLTVIGRIKARRKEWETAWIVGNAGSRVLRGFLTRPIITRAVRWGASALHLHAGWIETDLIARCHQAGLRVGAWTVDDPDAISRMASAGVNSVITNIPDIARGVLDRDARS